MRPAARIAFTQSRHSHLHFNFDHYERSYFKSRKHNRGRDRPSPAGSLRQRIYGFTTTLRRSFFGRACRPKALSPERGLFLFRFRVQQEHNPHRRTMNSNLRLSLNYFPRRKNLARLAAKPSADTSEEVLWGFYLLLAKIITSPLQPVRVQRKGRDPR